MRILVACVGNIFFGDDAFGVEVARELSQRLLPKGVAVVDFGVRALDLTYALMDGYSAVILVDAITRGGQPGTLYLMEPAMDGTDLAGSGPLMEAHGMDPARVLHLASSLGGRIDRLLIVGCEPALTGDMENFIDGLSDPVRTAVGRAADLVMSLVGRIHNGEEVGGTGNNLKTCSEG
jgi:hydrogenase maturation protease